MGPVPGGDDVAGPPPSGVSPLTADAVTRVREGWADKLRVPVDALTSPGTRLFPRENATAVVVVQLGGSRVVVLPPATVAVVEPLDEDQLAHLPTLADRLGYVAPVRPWR